MQKKTLANEIVTVWLPKVRFVAYFKRFYSVYKFATCSGLDFSGLHFSSLHFSALNISRLNFSGLNVSG